MLFPAEKSKPIQGKSDVLFCVCIVQDPIDFGPREADCITFNHLERKPHSRALQPTANVGGVAPQPQSLPRENETDSSLPWRNVDVASITLGASTDAASDKTLQNTAVAFQQCKIVVCFHVPGYRARRCAAGTRVGGEGVGKIQYRDLSTT